MLGRNLPRREDTGKPTQVVDHGLQQAEFQRRPQEFKVEGQVFPARLPALLAEALVQRPVGRVELISNRLYRIAS